MNIDIDNIICGEKIQEIAELYLGLDYDFNLNPNIGNIYNKDKCFDISNINEYYNNPKIIFCYTHRIDILSSKIDFFLNEFILITHNSDYTLNDDNNYVKRIINNKNLKKWFAQNVIFQHEKICFIPIGLGNSQWETGILSFKSIFNKNAIKTKNIYFNFNIGTNFNKRQPCYEALMHKIEWLLNVSPCDNIKRLSEYKFCICPEGNGVDTHRLWEALYLKTVPIVIKSNFTNILKNSNIPLVIVDSWDNLNIEELNYEEFNFDSQDLLYLLNLDKIKRKIIECL